MKNHGGSMPLTAKSSSEDVFKYLKMSRKAFKRAYGGLYKDQIIEFDDNKTYFVK
jgi:predicted RNA-binding protein (virulence factor B family)